MEARKFRRLYKGTTGFDLSLGQKKGRPLTEFHVRLLIRVANGGKRYSLAKKCAEQSCQYDDSMKEIRLILPVVRMVVSASCHQNRWTRTGRDRRLARPGSAGQVLKDRSTMQTEKPCVGARYPCLSHGTQRHLKKRRQALYEIAKEA